MIENSNNYLPEDTWFSNQIINSGWGPRPVDDETRATIHCLPTCSDIGACGRETVHLTPTSTNLLLFDWLVRLGLQGFKIDWAATLRPNKVYTWAYTYEYGMVRFGRTQIGRTSARISSIAVPWIWGILRWNLMNGEF